MKIQINVRKEIDIVELQVIANVRYWEDSTINGMPDTERGDNIPCKMGSSWCPVIEVDTGKIKNWEIGNNAFINYKVCDEGIYRLIDSNGDVAMELDGYVPDCMCLEGNGYGDYIIMAINEEGIIQNWKPDFSEFEQLD